MDDIWQDAIRYNTWANLTLLDSCGGLNTAQLALSAPGTYGTVAATWLHLLGAEQRYLRRLTGAQPAISEKDEFPGIEALKDHARRNGDALLAAAVGLKPDDTTRVDYGGAMVDLRKSLIVVQAIHHGNDHRTHICTILGSHSIPYEDMDVWMYGLALHRSATV